MATLTGELISETYDSLLKVTDNNTITGIKKRITDGFGNDIPLLLSSTDIEIDGTFILSALTDLAPASKFLSLKADNSVGFRTSSELLSDIGGASSASISGTTGRLSKFTSTGAVGNSILNEIGNAIHLTDGTSSYASFGINNPGIDNDAYIGSTINNDFLIKINNVEALRIDTALRLKIANIQNALGDTDKFLVSEDGVVKYRTGSEVLSDIGGASASSYVPYIGATSNVDLGASNITATSLIKAGGVDTQFLKADGSVDNNNYLTANDLPSTLSLYATNVAAAVAGYFKLVTTIDDPDYNTIAVDVPTGEITTTNQLIASLVSPVNLINGNPGVFNVTTTGNITRISGSGEAEFFFRIYKRDSGGVETLVGTSGNTIPVINTGYSEFFATAIWNDGIFDVTDSIVLKYYANRIAGGSNPTYQFQFGGDQPVRTTVPIPTAVIPNIFLEQLADVEDGVEANNDGIFFDSSVSLWKYKSVAEVLGYTPVSSTGTLNYIPKFSGANSLINSTIFEDATGVAIGVPFSDPSFLLYVNGGIKANGNSTINGDLTASKFIVPGGTSSQFLKADGSKDANSYALASALSDLVTLSTTQTITGEKKFTAGNIFIDSRSYFAEDNGQSGQAGYTQMITLADSFSFINGATTKSALFAYGGGVRSYILPSSNGTLALTSDLSAYLPLTGGTLTGVLTLNSGVGSNPNFASTTNGLEITSDGSTASNRNIIFKIASTTALSIDNSTNVAIGYTTNPSLYKLDVNGTGRFSGNLNISLAAPALQLFSTTTSTGYNIYQYTDDKFYIGRAGGADLFTMTSTGAATFSSTINIKDPALANTQIAKASFFGYSSSYVTTIIGNTNAQTLAFNVDVSANPGGSFSGNGNEYLWRNTGSFKTPNAANTEYNTLFNWNSSGQMTFTGAATFSSSVSVGGLLEVTNSFVDFTRGGKLLRINPNFSNLNTYSQIETASGMGLRFAINGSDKLSIDSGGNVGIGTTTPSSKLTISGTSANTESGQIRIINPGANEQTFQIGYNTTSDYAYLNAYKAGIGYKPISLNPDGGNVLIGLTADFGYLLSVNGTAYIQGTLLLGSLGTGLVYSSSGTLTSTNPSDKRLKENIETVSYGLSDILKLRPVSYLWKDDKINQGKQFGFIAQEVKEIMPDAIKEFGDEVKYLGLEKDAIYVTLINAIKELNEKIIQLENK